MSPLALYIEQVSGHEPVSPTPHAKVAVYPPSPPKNPIFESFRSAPTLGKTRTNRIIIYPGSFNPPHRGHLHLLKHIFIRGAHDLNVIAAIVLPRSDEGVAKKVRLKDGNFMLGRDERCLLWKQDPCFPPWAWVYEDSTATFTEFSERLIQATKKDGYSLEFVSLYGAGSASPSSPPGSAYGCQTIIMSDVARGADFQRYSIVHNKHHSKTSRRLRDFPGYTEWRRIRVNEGELQRHAKAKASDALLAIRTICPKEASRMLEDGTGYVEEATETAVATAIRELKAVLTCQRQLEGRTINLRFVKCEGVDLLADYNHISSTTVRDVMSKEHGIKLREALDWMALSADLLWRCKDSWIDKARLGTGCCINFQESTEELRLPETPRSYERPPSFDEPRSPEELELVETNEESPSIEKPPSLENPTSHELTPSFEEPPPINEKKRRFSATGLEA